MVAWSSTLKENSKEQSARGRGGPCRLSHKEEVSAFDRLIECLQEQADTKIHFPVYGSEKLTFEHSI